MKSVVSITLCSYAYTSMWNVLVSSWNPYLRLRFNENFNWFILLIRSIPSVFIFQICGVYCKQNTTDDATMTFTWVDYGYGAWECVKQDTNSNGECRSESRQCWMSMDCFHGHFFHSCNVLLFLKFIIKSP